MMPTDDVQGVRLVHETARLRFGVLGAARITKTALLEPARAIGIEVFGIAARDPSRARTYARDHGIRVVHETYSDLLNDPEIDAVYIPLPASAHAHWTLRAIAAGKHVLCEKPFTANAAEAQLVAAETATSGRVLMEAYHTGHHPLMSQLRQYLDSDLLGEVVSARATFGVAIPPGKDIRWNVDLGGGGLLDVGYYPVRILRDLFGQPTVVDAKARERDGIDASLTAHLEFPEGVRGDIACSMWPPKPSVPSLTITGTAGTIRVRMPYHPQTMGRIKFTSSSRRWSVRPDLVTTYEAQLTAFRDAALNGGPNITDADAAVQQMRTLDEIYQAAGMEPRCLPTPTVS